MADGVTIEFRGDDAKLNAVLAGIKSAVDGLKEQVDMAADTAKWVLGFMAVEHEIKRAMAEQSQMIRFKDAIEANGFATEVWAEKLDKSAMAMASVTTYSKDAIRSAMMMGLNLGIGADQMENATKQAAALSQITGASLTASFRQLTMAQEGHFTQFNRTIPKMRDAKTDTERLALLNDKLRIGWKQAIENTPEHTYARLTSELKSLSRIIGDTLLPSLMEMVEWARAVLVPVKAWITANRELLASIITYTAAIATAVMWGPRIISMLSSIGSTILWMVTSPVGLLITGLTSITVWLAYASGEGENFTSRMADGFRKMVDWLDKACGSWEQFKNTLRYVFDSVKIQAEGIFDYLSMKMSTVWEVAGAGAKTTWAALKPWLVQNVMMPIADVFSGITYTMLEAPRLAIGMDPSQSMDDYKTDARHELSKAFRVKIDYDKGTVKGNFDSPEENDVQVAIQNVRSGATINPETGKTLTESEAEAWVRQRYAKQREEAAKKDMEASVTEQKAFDLRQKDRDRRQGIVNDGYKQEMERGGARASTTEWGSKVVDAVNTVKDKSSLLGMADALLRKHVPAYDKAMTAAAEERAAREKAASTGPDDVEWSDRYRGKGAAVAFEDATSMYKRISAAAAGQDPLVTLVNYSAESVKLQQRQLDEAMDLNKKVEKLGGGFAA